MKKFVLAFIFISLLAGMSLAMDLTGKTGIGLRADSLSVRRFITNNFAIDISGDYNSSTLTGTSDSHSINGSIGGLYVKEVLTNVLFETGVTFQGWTGTDAGADAYGFSVNPFVGGECFVNDHFGIDGKVFVGVYSNQMDAGTRMTTLDFFRGNLGAHIYF